MYINRRSYSGRERVHKLVGRLQWERVCTLTGWETTVGESVYINWRSYSGRERVHKLVGRLQWERACT